MTEMAEIIGILNYTPDSFSDGGEYNQLDKALARAHQMFDEGAVIVDIGAESTRPGATPLSAEEEQARLKNILPLLLKEFQDPGVISLDSYHPETHRWAQALGPVIVNDVTGMNNPAMLKLVAETRPPATIIGQLPPNMSIQEAHQRKPHSKLEEVRMGLLVPKEVLVNMGVPAETIWLDPDIGFGKQPELNRELVKFAKEVPDETVVIGVSRKSFLGPNHKTDLSLTLAAAEEAVEAGARYLRVHDVKAHKELLQRLAA